ncbi:hypothetical protein FA95DRAFT_1603334 [Auriscalpium vulgare]|uniref:Uncharacterized protein n=1 Tax=Auriscalpium vulgare TaxID=40419 RepID=A0ACB8S3M0_9AGAM|nr:hypothetical protein FA95DRAFT_1603334 [Auriscalpium vulgare]
MLDLPFPNSLLDILGSPSSCSCQDSFIGAVAGLGFTIIPIHTARRASLLPSPSRINGVYHDALLWHARNHCSSRRLPPLMIECGTQGKRGHCVAVLVHPTRIDGKAYLVRRFLPDYGTETFDYFCNADPYALLEIRLPRGRSQCLDIEGRYADAVPSP